MQKPSQKKEKEVISELNVLLITLKPNAPKYKNNYDLSITTSWLDN